VPTLRGLVAAVGQFSDDVAPDPMSRRSWALCLGDVDLL
jgi:hypothetical protein